MKKRNVLGAVRRFDDLGRIIVPKEMRRELQIKEGDDMEITMAGNRIIIKRHQPVRIWEELCGSYLAAFARRSTAACAICGTERVLGSASVDIPKGAQMSQAAKESIQGLEPYLYDEEDQVPLLADGRYTVDTLYPVGTEKMPLGGVALLQGCALTDTDRLRARLLADIITEIIKKDEDCL